MTLPGAEYEQINYGMSLYAGSAKKMEGSPQQPWLTTSTETPPIILEPIRKASVRRATTVKPQAKPDSAALMRKYGIKRSKDGTLLIPCSATPEQAAEVRAALKR